MDQMMLMMMCHHHNNEIVDQAGRRRPQRQARHQCQLRRAPLMVMTTMVIVLISAMNQLQWYVQPTAVVSARSAASHASSSSSRTTMMPTTKWFGHNHRRTTSSDRWPQQQQKSFARSSSSLSSSAVRILRGGGCKCHEDDKVATSVTNNENDNTATTAVAISSSSSEEQERLHLFQVKCNERATFVKHVLCQRLEYVSSGKRMRDITKWIQHHKKHPKLIVAIDGTTIDEEQQEQNEEPSTTSLSTPSNHHNRQQQSLVSIGGGAVTTKALPSETASTRRMESSSTMQQQQQLSKDTTATTTIHVMELESVAMEKIQRERDPFPLDRMNLDIVMTSQTPPNCYYKQQQSESWWRLHRSATAGNSNNNSNDITPQQQHPDHAPPTPLQIGLRLVQLTMNFAPVWSTLGIALVSTRFREHYWYKWLAQSIGKSGAAWIKWGQWSSTRRDMFPETFCECLSTLHAAAPAHDWSFSQSSVEESLGLGPGTLHCVFDTFDTQPIASGSIAQVHKAVLCGIPIAVKIRHPRVRELMEIDFRLMTAAATLFDKVPALSWLHIRESVEQFSYTIAAQAYLQVEAHHLEVLNYNFRHWSKVNFPTPFYASSSVIIETFERGKIASDIINQYESVAALANNNNNNNGRTTTTVEDGLTVVEVDDDDEEANEVHSNTTNATADEATSTTNGTAETAMAIHGHELMPTDLAKFIVTTGVSLYLKMLLVDNLMHADFHPGNILVDAQYREKKQLPTTEERSLAVANADDDSIQSQHQQQAQYDVLSAMNVEMDKIHITIVDAGMVAKLTEEESLAFIGLFAAMGAGDGNEAAEYVLQFSVDNNMTLEQRRYFMADMVTLFATTCRGYGTGVDVGEVLRGVLNLVRKHRVRIDANFATLVINALCVESMAYRVCPTYNVLDAARPFFETYHRIKAKYGSNPMKAPMFNPLMAISAMKKDICDKLFFIKEASRKLVRQRQIAEHIQLASNVAAPQLAR